MTNDTPAGWYDDPDGADQLRYWDGSQWTTHYSSRPATPAPPSGSPVSQVIQGDPGGTAEKGAVESVLGFVEDRRKRIETKKKEEAEAAEAAAKAAAERSRIQTAKTAAFVRKHWKALLAVLVALTLIISIGAWREADAQAKSNTIAVDSSSGAFEGQNYEDVATQLREAGFTNIKTEAVEDLVLGLLTKDGAVETVKIGGDTDYASGTRFSKDVGIVVSYHTFPKTEEPTAEVNDAPPAEDVKDASSLTPDEQTYIGELATINLTVSEALRSLAELTQDSDRTVLLLSGDQDTIIEAATYVAVIQNGENEVDALTPPARFRKVHSLYANAMDSYVKAVDHFGSGVDNTDAKEFEAAASDLNAGGQKMAEATAALEAAQN